MLVYFYEDSDTITMREYRADNCYEPIQPAMVMETRYDVNYIPLEETFVTEADYLAKVMEMTLDDGILKKLSEETVPLVLIFYGGKDVLMTKKNIERFFDRYRNQINVIPVYYDSERVNDFVKTIYYERTTENIFR